MAIPSLDVASDPLSYLFSLEQFGIKFGLERMSAIVARLGHPERSFRSVHIAGTNGKGSVTAMVDAALRAAGRRSARYTSPHLVDLAERFVIAGRPVSAEDLRAAITHVRVVVDQLQAEGTIEVHPTFFEVTTAVGFELFRRGRADTAAVEVGLGGRLDATNVVHPIATAITSIALDHQPHLGSTIADIAVEKAGIIKPGVPVVVGSLDAEALAPIEAVARRQCAPLVRAWEGVEARRIGESAIWLRTPARDYGTMTLGLRGAHQVRNAVVAVRVLELLERQGIAVPPAAIASGLAEPSWPGRLDLRRLNDGREALLDAAHNPAGAAALASYLNEQQGGRLPLVFGVMADKDVDGMLEALVPAVERIVVTRASNRRAADPHALAARVARLAPRLPAAVVASPADALRAAWRTSRRIVVAGSIFLVGDVLREIS